MNDDARSPEGGAPLAIVQEADCSERVVVLKIRVPGRSAFVMVGAAKGGAAAGLLPQGARQDLWGGKLPPAAPRQRAREAALALARVVAIVGAEVFFEPHVKPREDASADADANATTGGNAMGASAAAQVGVIQHTPSTDTNGTTRNMDRRQRVPKGESMGRKTVVGRCFIE